MTAPAKTILDLMPERIIVSDPLALTADEIAKKKGLSRSHTQRLLQIAVESGEAERVFKRVGEKVVPAYRVKAEKSGGRRRT